MKWPSWESFEVTLPLSLISLTSLHLSKDISGEQKPVTLGIIAISGVKKPQV